MKFNNHLINIYIFIDSFNNLIEKKILKLKNIRIIYENANMPSENFFRVIKLILYLFLSKLFINLEREVSAPPNIEYG